MLAYNTGTLVAGGLSLATIVSTFCQPRWTLRPIVLLALIFLTLGFGIKTLLQGYQLKTERQHHETVVRKLKAQQSDMLQRVLQLEQSL
ncbi:hypothetical protein COCOBI_01-1610 [Coccomyxa sp. Obi]|nr:hypothetical protein COCOBI_01-1610 [Coccomyxa sp. Obi]